MEQKLWKTIGMCKRIMHAVHMAAARETQKDVNITG